MKWVHSFYGYLYRLPMKLTDEGVHLTEATENETLGGKEYRVLQVNFDAAVGSDNWFYYLNPETYAMEAYRFNHGEPESGEYILLEQEVVVDGIRIPKVRMVLEQRQWVHRHRNTYKGRATLGVQI